LLAGLWPGILVFYLASIPAQWTLGAVFGAGFAGPAAFLVPVELLLPAITVAAAVATDNAAAGVTVG
jgi:hypothetical protein